MKTTMRNVFPLVATLLLMPLAALCAAPDDLGWMRGANYVPSYAKNDVQLWLEYDPVVIARELGYAQRLKLNTVRVFLHVAVFEKQPEKLLADFENFLTLADKHGIKVMPVLFDNCFDPQEVDITSYKDKMWIPSPGFPRLGEKDWPAMEKYITAFVGKYRDDKRIVLWDVMNEPDITKYFREESGKKQVVDFLRRAIKRVKAEKPSQPVGTGWAQAGRIELTADLVDVLVMHCYDGPKGLGGNIRRVKELGKKLNKPMIINEFAGRLTQPLEKALPVVAREKIGWCFWELMIGKTQFSQGRVPYQGHIYPDGTCFSAVEVATILNPAGFQGDAAATAREAGFAVSEKQPKAFVEESFTFSPLWTKRLDTKVAGGRYWSNSTPGETVTKEVSGTSVELVLIHGIDHGIVLVTIDGKPAGVPEIDTYAKEVDWSRKTVVAKDLPPGKHTVVVTVTGRDAAVSRNCLVQFVDITAPDEARVGVQIPALPSLSPLLDYPIRDTAITVGPDGTYYLTGTTGFPSWWTVNEGIRIWKSRDLKSWEPLGLVWSFAKDATWQVAKKGKCAIWAPELHYFNNTFWIAYCVNDTGLCKGGGTGILRSKSGNAGGPYEDVKPDGPLTDKIDASLFRDDDGKVYFVWQNGMIARMKDDMSGLAEAPRHLKPANAKEVGFEGAFLTKINGRYHLIASVFGWKGLPGYHCTAASSGSIYGPYGDAYLAIPHGGHNVLFRDNGGQWYSTFFGNDDGAPFRERAAIVPIHVTTEGRIQPGP